MPDTTPDAVAAAYDALIQALKAAALDDGADFERAASFRQQAITARGRWVSGTVARPRMKPAAAEGR